MNHVFILGAGRSGTKILRDCLGAASDVSCIPYDVGYVWRSGNEAITHDELLPSHLTPEKARIIRSSIGKLAKTASKSPDYTTVLEKSVPNALRPLFIKSVFPDAKLIHMVRDGRQVIESSMRNWQNPSDTGYFLDKLRYFPLRNVPYALWYAKNRFIGGNSKNVRIWGPRYNGMQDDANSVELVEVCARQWVNCIDICDEQLAQLPSSDVHLVKYEDFVSSVSTVVDACTFAGISDNHSVEAFYREKVRSDRAVSTTRKANPQQIAIIENLAKTALVKHGYA